MHGRARNRFPRRSRTSSDLAADVAGDVRRLRDRRLLRREGEPAQARRRRCGSRTSTPTRASGWTAGSRSAGATPGPRLRHRPPRRAGPGPRRRWSTPRTSRATRRRQCRSRACDAPHTATARELLRARRAGSRSCRARPCKPRLPERARAAGAVARASPTCGCTSIPDGGVARLRVYGERRARAAHSSGAPAASIWPRSRTAARIAAVSDQFFGPPSNLLLPGRGVNMGDGWETKRRRTPGLATGR